MIITHNYIYIPVERIEHPFHLISQCPQIAQVIAHVAQVALVAHGKEYFYADHTAIIK